MKKALITLALMFVAFTANAQSCPDNKHPHAIDLGLPSGIKWACCNVGADKPEDNGGYYAWGETEVKDDYEWNNYIHCDGSSSTCHNLGSDIAGTKYDVAHMKWGGKWQMPNPFDIFELFEKSSFEGATINEQKGLMITGPNGKSIFLPAKVEFDIFSNEFFYLSTYWISTFSSNTEDTNTAYVFFINDNGRWAVDDDGDRCDGNLVRPVWVP